MKPTRGPRVKIVRNTNPKLQLRSPQGYILQQRDPTTMVVRLDEPASLHSTYAEGYVQINAVEVKADCVVLL